MGLRRTAGCLARQVPLRSTRVAVAVGVSRDAPLHRPRDRRAPPPPLARDSPPAHRAPGRHRRRPRQTRESPRPPPFVRDPPARVRIRHPDDPAAPRSQGRQHHDDLYARPAPRPPWLSKSLGPPAVIAVAEALSGLG